MRTLAEFIKHAHTHGLHDRELETLDKLVRAAVDWSNGMPDSTHSANNDNGALLRAIRDAVDAFGRPTAPWDPHRFCHWKCVAKKPAARCEKDQPTTFCTCGIEFPTILGACWSCQRKI